VANSTFTISSTVATFRATIQSSSQDIGDLERLTVRAYIATAAEWLDFVALVTSKYHVHAPLGGNIVIDVARGAGAGALVLSGLGTTTALLVELRRTDYLPSGRSVAQAVFLLTAAWS
jgi:hypothetical protein